MANKFNLDRKKRKLKRLSMRRNFDTVLLDNGKVKEYCGERTNALIIYKHKSKQLLFTNSRKNLTNLNSCAKTERQTITQTFIAKAVATHIRELQPKKFTAIGRCLLRPKVGFM